jgi:Xaa-Pro aminopeptidase
MPTPENSTIAQRLTPLRSAMRAHDIDAVIVPTSDPHLSEYVPAHWQGRLWLSGFTGSSGTFIATRDFAGIWTDGRYWAQAELELAGSGVELLKTPSGNSLQHLDWLAANLVAGQTVAVDGCVLGLATARLLEAALAAKGVLLRLDLDLLEQAWTDRPGLPTAPVVEHLAPHATIARGTKLARLRAAMAALGADHHLISTLDDIAWLFNLRGADVAYNPVFIAHALIDEKNATLFILDGKIGPDLRARLALDGIVLAPYGGVGAALAALAAPARLLVDPRRISASLRAAVPASVAVIEAVNPSTLAKSIKSAAEVSHVRSAMEHDGAALCEFFAWLEARSEPQLAHMSSAPESVSLTELDIDLQLTAARARQPGFVSPSFATIAGFNANGALIHYRATEAAHAVIDGDGLLLIDSGGQYLGGTTDITRVVPVGAVSVEQRRDFTLVLKGLIALSAARFPRSTRSPLLDALARAPLWAAGVDYGHGTGHGVGYFLNVHEGPQSISPSTLPELQTAMEEGMITSIEPGIYRPGRWGIRLENLVLNCAAEATEFGQFLRFETLTLCPIDTRCIAKELLRSDELAWLNAYHATVRARLAPLLCGAALAWLNHRTEEF